MVNLDAGKGEKNMPSEEQREQREQREKIIQICKTSQFPSVFWAIALR